MRNPLLARFVDEIALVAPERQARFEACLTEAAKIVERLDTDTSAPAMQDDFWPKSDDWRAAYRPYVVSDGVLQIPVKGVLLSGFPWAIGAWATGYEYIRKAYERGMADPAVRGIALVIDSPGGEVRGNFDLVDRMYAGKKKPVRAYATDSAYSAAYSIASVADKISVTRTGGVGSIGVVTMHVDVSKAMEEWGYKITFIYAGKHKVDGNPYESLKPEVKERIQARVDTLYGMFVSTVARNRPMLTEKEIRATEALTYGADEAIEAKLADMKGPPLDDSLAAFAVELSSDEGDEMMSKQDNSAVDQAAVDAARAEGVSQGRKEGASAERERISAILGCDEAKGRETLANHLAMKTDTAPDAAKAILAAAPTSGGSAATGKTAFENAMEKTGNPEVGADAKVDGGDKELAEVDAIFASAGYGPRKK